MIQPLVVSPAIQIRTANRTGSNARIRPEQAHSGTGVSTGFFRTATSGRVSAKRVAPSGVPNRHRHFIGVARRTTLPDDIRRAAPTTTGSPLGMAGIRIVKLSGKNSSIARRRGGFRGASVCPCSVAFGCRCCRFRRARTPPDDRSRLFVASQIISARH